MTAQSPHRNTSRPRRSTATRTVPTTVWASGTDPLPSGDHWPEPILSRAVREFSRVGDRVLLLGWPAPTARSGLALTPPDAGAALATIEGLDREGRIEFGVPGSHRPAELIVVSLLGDERDPVGAADRIAELALARLSDGGLLVVLARCGHSSDGVLSDPAGPVVAAAQTVDLLYLQHIIAVPLHSDAVIAPAPGSAPARHTVAHIDVFAFLRVGQQQHADIHDEHDEQAAA